ncbi:MAG TPA: sn-glycerol-3-phosphate ABC transporter ATP-binding protein UgpC [Streptosporangiaceae bacterium]|nr:sn-glycerol-3-phosphate ABC transporter ATP-binding protein UgpC [Streptosporangiaceae bacterium]
MSAITLSGLTKIYPTGVRAIDSLDLEVRDHEFVVLVGPSGCGKTTALRMVAGLEAVTNGTIRFGDRVVNDVSPRQRDVAMVFQSYALYPHLSVAENIGFALINKKVPRAERERRVRSAAELLGLSDLLNRKPDRLSGGQRQRVAMGRAIVREPSAFLMDEPLSSLDAKLRVQMRSEVLRVHHEIGAATLYVTHDQVEAMTMGDRVAVLHAGVLQQYGTPRELYQRPANLFVAGFIGSPEMNLYEASISDGDLVLGSQRIAGIVRPALTAYSGRKVIAGVRPEDLVLGADGNGTAPAALTARVRVVEMLGSEQHVFFSIDAPAAGARMLAAATGEIESGLLASEAHNGTARVGPRTPVRAGDRITLSVEPQQWHFFDPDTGLTIR